MKVHNHSEKEKQALEYLRLVPFCIFMHSILESARCTTNSKGQRSHIWEVQKWKHIWQIDTQMVCLDGGGQVDKWTSGQQPLNEKLGHYHHWPRLLPCALCIIQTMGLWAQILGHHTNTPFAKPFSHIHYSLTTTTYARTHLSLLKLDLNELAGGDRGRRRQSRNC